MSKMATRPVYGKYYLKLSSLEPKDQADRSVGDVDTANLAQMVVLGLPEPTLWQVQTTGSVSIGLGIYHWGCGPYKICLKIN